MRARRVVSVAMCTGTVAEAVADVPVNVGVYDLGAES